MLEGEGLRCLTWLNACILLTLFYTPCGRISIHWLLKVTEQSNFLVINSVLCNFLSWTREKLKSMSKCFTFNTQVTVSSKQTKLNFGSNRNKPKQDLFRVCFGLFRETKNKKFRFGSVFRTYIETTESNRTVSKQTETTLNFLKNTKICFLSNCFGWSSVWYETSKISVLV